MKRIIVLTSILFCFAIGSAFANKTSVEIKVASQAKKGTEVTINIDVTHKGNSKMHHTEWVYLKIDGKEVKRWNYDKKNLPPDEKFTVEYKFTPSADFAIEAEGSCNIHGSAGPKNASVKAID